MIYDRLERLGSYRGLSKNLDAAIDCLAGARLDLLPLGISSLEGETLKANAMEYETKEAGEARFEAHLRYIDIQLLLEGRECCYFAPLEDLEPAEPFSLEKDVGFFREPAGGGCRLPLRPGHFALFFPWDGHKPGCVLEGGDRVRKIVIKVAV